MSMNLQKKIVSPFSRPGDIAIEDRWLFFLEMAPIIWLLLHLYWLSVLFVLINYSYHMFSKRAAYLTQFGHRKVFAYVCCPIAYGAALTVSFLPEMHLGIPTLSNFNLANLPMIFIVMMMLALRMALSGDIVDRTDREKDEQ